MDGRTEGGVENIARRCVCALFPLSSQGRYLDIMQQHSVGFIADATALGGP
jgi:hypothetical protein